MFCALSPCCSFPFTLFARLPETLSQCITTLSQCTGTCIMSFTQGQLHNIIKAKKNSTGKNLAQYRILESMLVHLASVDPTGNYELATEAASPVGTRRFVSFYVAPSAAKRSQSRFTKVASVDSSYLTSDTGGQLCALLTYDADKHPMPLCFGLFRTETKDAWGRFMSRVFRDFPHFTTIISDGSKGLESLDNMFRANNVHHGRCSWHILEKNTKNIKMTRLFAFHHVVTMPSNFVTTPYSIVTMQIQSTPATSS